MFFKPNHHVTQREIRRYGEAYLKAFQNDVLQFKHDDWGYFPGFVSFWNRTIELKAMISSFHGAAIEFIVNASASHFHTPRTDERIEVAVFGGAFYEAQGLPFKMKASRIVFALESGVDFITSGQCMFEVFENATLAVVGSNWTIDGVRYSNPITIKGSNMYESWAADRAVWDAEFDFRYDLAYALNQSEGVREYFAYSELKNALSKIADRLKNDPNYGWSQLENDLDEISRVASEKYGVTRPDFVEDVFNVVKEKSALSKKLPILPIVYNSNYVYTILFSVLLDLSYIFAMSLERLLRHFNKNSLRPIKNLVKQFGEWFTFILVLLSFVTNAPFDYEWIIHVPILLIQLFALTFISNAVKFRSASQLNWEDTFYRLVFGVFFLSCTLVTALVLLPAYHTMPSLFDYYPVIIGEATVLSMLVATIGAVITLLSQLVYVRHFERSPKAGVDQQSSFQ